MRQARLEGLFCLIFAAIELACSDSKQSVGSISIVDTTEPVREGGAPDAASDAGAEPELMADKIDLLFMIDNSISMADKQQVLQAAVPNLVERLLNPVCIDEAGNEFPARTPADPGATCPNGLEREFAPLLDMNVGIITSSLGGFGATTSACTSEESLDMAHLIGALPRGERVLANSNSASPLGFLEWRPGDDSDAFAEDFAKLVTVTGEHGCGYEPSLEAWYRFLIDPAPPRQWAHVSCSGGTDTNCVEPRGVDAAVLAQRAQFLRSDSLVAIVMVTDENDCSIRPNGKGWLVADGSMQPMYRAASACDAVDDRCCHSCGSPAPEGCEPDPICGDPDDLNEPSDRLPVAEDPPSLRCFQQKRRFGDDFLYPTARYRNALAEPRLCLDRADLSVEGCDENGRIVENPLYRKSQGGDIQRSSQMVFLAGIIGVPWQDLARDPNDLDRLDYKTYSELETDDVWKLVLGNGITPQDPLMRESVSARTGNHPITGDPLAPPDASMALANPINGHEWEIPRADNLQYACIFPVPTPRNCSTVPQGDGCDCRGVGSLQEARPLCQDPETGAYGNIQYFAKAYPGLRHLEVLRDYGRATGNSIVASVCARNMNVEGAQDYGYNPAVLAIVARLKERLVRAAND